MKHNTSRSPRTTFVVLLAFWAGFGLAIVVDRVDVWSSLRHRVESIVFPRDQVSDIVQRSLPIPSPEAAARGRRRPIPHPPAFRVEIPLRFLPSYRIEPSSNNHTALVQEVGHTTITVPTDQLALVMVDTWDTNDPQPGQEPSRYLENLRTLLTTCRAHGVTVIHAPSRPVVKRYRQWHQLRQEISQRFPHLSTVDPRDDDLMAWPDRDNPRYDRLLEVRMRHLRPLMTLYPVEDRDISGLLLPRDGEFVVDTHREYRYVLWKNRIRVLLYVGGSLNDCLLQRDAGISPLAGSDRRRAAFTIVVAEDCTEAVASPTVDAATTKRVLLDFLMREIAFVTSSSQLNFYEVADDRLPSPSLKTPG